MIQLHTTIGYDKKKHFTFGRYNSNYCVVRIVNAIALASNLQLINQYLPQALAS